MSGTNEVRVVNEGTGGAKGTKDERFGLLPWDQLGAVARLYNFGAKKYDADNWRRGYEWHLSYDALMRHAAAWWNGEFDDEESGEDHMTSVVFHALALMYFRTAHPDLDDRPCTTMARLKPSEPVDMTAAAMDMQSILERTAGTEFGAHLQREVDRKAKLFEGVEVRSLSFDLQPGSGTIDAVGPALVRKVQCPLCRALVIPGTECTGQDNTGIVHAAYVVTLRNCASAPENALAARPAPLEASESLSGAPSSPDEPVSEPQEPSVGSAAADRGEEQSNLVMVQFSMTVAEFEHLKATGEAPTFHLD